MGIQRVQHPVAGGVLDVAQIHVRAPQPVLDEGEHVAQVRRDVPRTGHVVDAKALLLRVDAEDLAAPGVLLQVEEAGGAFDDGGLRFFLPRPPDVFDVGEVVDAAAPNAEKRPADLRIRLPRGQLRSTEPDEWISRRRW